MLTKNVVIYVNLLLTYAVLMLYFNNLKYNDK